MAWISSYYAAQNGTVSVAQIPWNLYTQVKHFAAAPFSNGNIDMHYLTTAEIAAFKARPAGAKALVSLKDNDQDMTAFASATSPGTLKSFVANLKAFILNNGYDGVEIDWEANVNTTQYNNFISALRQAMPAALINMSAGDWNNIPSVAVASQGILDQVNVMCYDMDNAWTPTWFNCAMQAGGSGQRACNTRMNAFTSVTPGKLGLGVPFFCRKWVGAMAPLVAGNFGQPATLDFGKLVNTFEYQQPYMQYDQAYKASYLSVPPPINEFISYLSQQQLADMEAWRKAQGFGGWSEFCLNQDDSNFSMSRSVWTLVGNQPPTPPATYAAPVTMANGDLMFKKVT